MSTALTTSQNGVQGGLTAADWEERKRILLQVMGLDGNAAQADVLIMLCQKYDLDPFLKHIVLIKGKPFVTRDGLLHKAHTSGVLDGIEAAAARTPEGEWAATCTVYRKDMGRPVRYTVYEGEHKPQSPPAGSAWQRYPRAMLIKCAESAALRRAFDVALGAVEELGYDGTQPASALGTVTVIEPGAPAAPPAPTVTLVDTGYPPLPAEAAPVAPAFDFAAWSADLNAQAGHGVTISELAAQINQLRDDLTDAEYEAVMLWYRQVKASRKAARATDEALLARVVDAGRTEQERADAAKYFLDKAQDAAALFARVAQLTVLDFPRPILDVLVAEQRERLGLPDDDAADVLEATATEVAETPARPTWLGDDNVPF